MERNEIHRSEHDWLVHWRDDRAYNAACGPENLHEALQRFLAWAS
jgi:hypothetical protein